MRWANLDLVGYVILLVGLVAARWKLGVARRGVAGWTAIGIVISLGIGIMVSVANSPRKETIQIQN